MQTEKFYTCRYDRPFKEVMLNEKNKDLLKLLLEHILKVKINKIEIKGTERNSGNMNIKRKTLDVLLETDIGKIGIELNNNPGKYIYPRNMAYISDIYANHILVGEMYNEETMIIQINLTYGMNKKEEGIKRYYIQDKKGNKFVTNFEIIEINMEYYMDLWYNKNIEGIEENKILVMLGLGKEDLEKLSKNDKVVSKYMEELKRVNENPEFRRFMSAEEDERKIFNSRMKEATETGLQQGLEKGIKQGIEQGIEQGINQRNIEIAKNMLKKNIDINIISETIGLSKEEIENLK